MSESWYSSHTIEDGDWVRTIVDGLEVMGYVTEIDYYGICTVKVTHCDRKNIIGRYFKQTRSGLHKCSVFLSDEEDEMVNKLLIDMALDAGNRELFNELVGKKEEGQTPIKSALT